MELRVEDQPDPLDVACLEAHLTESTSRLTGHDDLEELAIFLRNDDGDIEAGVYGWTWGGCCELQHLWVTESRRHEGLATRLLEEAEAEAGRRGCTQIVFFSHASQAPELYERRGYTVVGRVDDYPVGDAALWFRKPLT